MNNLDDLSKTIEREVHILHDISHETYERITNVVNDNESIKDPVNIRDSKTIIISKLKPFSYKLLQFIIARLDNVSKKTLHHIISVVLVKAFKFFPDNTDIYLMFCIKSLDADKDKFIKECLKDIVNRMDDEKKIYLNMLLCFISFVVIITGLCFVSKLNKKRKEIKKQKLLLN